MLSHIQLYATAWTIAQVPLPMGFSNGISCHFFLQGLFLTKGSNSCPLNLLYWQADSLPLALPGKPIVLTAAAAKSLQSCPTLCDPIDGSPPGSPVPGILQARTLEWVATSFSNAWNWKVKGKSLSWVRLLAGLFQIYDHKLQLDTQHCPVIIPHFTDM